MLREAGAEEVRDEEEEELRAEGAEEDLKIRCRNLCGLLGYSGTV